MMTKNDPLVRFDEIATIIVHFAGSRAPVIECEDLRSDPFGIKTIADRISAQRRDQNVSGADSFTAIQRQYSIAPRPERAYQNPKQRGHKLRHDNGLFLF